MAAASLAHHVNNGTGAGDEEDYDYVYDYDINESFATFDWTELGPSLVVYVLTFFIGIVGNCLILVAVIRHTHVKNSPVNVFLASLASADLLLILVCLPLKVAKLFSYTWTMGEFSCKLLYYMQSVSGICSVLNLTALSIERYYVIVHPLKAQYLCTISKAKKTVLATWISSFILAIPIILVQVHMKVGERVVAYWCVRDFDSPIWWQVEELYFLIVILVVPTLVMGFSYGKIIFEVCRVVKQRRKMTQTGYVSNKATKHQNGQETELEMSRVQSKCCTQSGENGEDVAVGEKHSMLAKKPSTIATDLEASRSNNELGGVQSPSPKMDKDTKQVVRMLISIVITFVICWGPLLIFNVMQAFGLVGNFLLGVEKHLKSIFSLMAYLNSCLNPIIYGFMSKSFRQSFVSDLRVCCCQCCHDGSIKGARNTRRPLPNYELTCDGNGRPVQRTSRTTSVLYKTRRGNHFHTVTDDGMMSATEISMITTTVANAPKAGAKPKKK